MYRAWYYRVAIYYILAKMFIYEVIILRVAFSMFVFCQNSPVDFANEIFEACKANDQKRFEQFMAGPEEIASYIKQLDPSITDTQSAMAYTRYKDRAVKGFKLWQDTARELKLDLTTVKITKTNAEDRPIPLKRDGKQLAAAQTKSIDIFFTCSGKKLCFRISDGIIVNGKWFLGDEYVQLHWLH